MRIIALLILLSMSSLLHAGDVVEHPIGTHTFTGKWISAPNTIRDEVQTLVFSTTGQATFTRDLANGDAFNFTSSVEQQTVLDDIILLELYDEKYGMLFKLVLSGWSVTDKELNLSRLYGMLYMYRNGKQFNGFPVSFVPAS